MFLADGFMGKSVFSNMTGTTGEGKARDFYTILSGCPQIWPIYPLYLASSPVMQRFAVPLVSVCSVWIASASSMTKWTFRPDETEKKGLIEGLWIRRKTYPQLVWIILKNRSEMLRMWKTYPQLLGKTAKMILHVRKLENLSTLDVEKLAQKHEMLFLIVFHIKCG